MHCYFSDLQSLRPTDHSKLALGPHRTLLARLPRLVTQILIYTSYTEQDAHCYYTHTILCHDEHYSNPYTPSGNRLLWCINLDIPRWYNKTNHRLSLDKYIASKWNRKPVTQEIVKRTWYPSLLQTSPDLTEDWITNPEVLVGTKPPRPPVHRGPRAVHRVPHYPTR